MKQQSNPFYYNYQLTVSKADVNSNCRIFDKSLFSIIAVIPAYNEGSRILKVIGTASKYVDEIIVVNDASQDDTSTISRDVGATVIDLPDNMGAGYATRVGCDLAVSKGADIIITLDADGQHATDDIPKLVNTLIDEKLDIVFGSRPRDENMPFINKIGGTLLYSLSQFLFKVNIEDTQTGFHAFTKECYPKLRWKYNRYAFVSEFVYKVYENNLSCKEVPVKTIYIKGKQGMKKRDGLRALVLIVLWRLGAYGLLCRFIKQ